MAGVLQEAHFLGGVRVTHLVSFLCSSCFFFFIQCLVPNIANVSGLSIFDCPFGFSQDFPFLIAPSFSSNVYVVLQWQ